MNVISSNAVMIFLSTKSFIPGIMNTYCWIHGTFTIPSQLAKRVGPEVAHPGVAPIYNRWETVVD